jgi:hypothetical protein
MAVDFCKACESCTCPWTCQSRAASCCMRSSKPPFISHADVAGPNPPIKCPCSPAPHHVVKLGLGAPVRSIGIVDPASDLLRDEKESQSNAWWSRGWQAWSGCHEHTHASSCPVSALSAQQPHQNGAVIATANAWNAHQGLHVEAGPAKQLCSPWLGRGHHGRGWNSWLHADAAGSAQMSCRGGSHGTHRGGKHPGEWESKPCATLECAGLSFEKTADQSRSNGTQQRRRAEMVIARGSRTDPAE